MGFLDRLLGKKRSADRPSTAETAVRRAPGMETLQTSDQQAETRRSMEAEMTAQREKRGQGSAPQE